MSSILDTAKFVKILNITKSDSDHEALVAIRTANRILKESGKSWDDLVRPSPASGTTGLVTVPEVERTVEWCLSNVGPRFDTTFLRYLQRKLRYGQGITQAEHDSLQRIRDMTIRYKEGRDGDDHGS